MAILYSEPCPICGFKHNHPSDQTEHTTEKACETCGTVKPLSAFPRNNGAWDGHRKICLDCATAEKAQLATEKALVVAAKRPRMATTDTSDAGRHGSFAQMSPEQVALWARSALKRPTLRILDTETTGRGPRWGGGVDELVELCVVDSSGTPLLNTLVKPKGTMHPTASAMSGITDAMLGRMSAILRHSQTGAQPFGRQGCGCLQHGV